MPWVTCIIYQLGINFLSHAAESAWMLTSVVEIKGDEIWCNSVASSPFGYCCLQRTEFLCQTSLVDLQQKEKRVGIGSLTLNQLLASNTHKNNWSVLFVPVEVVPLSKVHLAVHQVLVAVSELMTLNHFSDTNFSHPGRKSRLSACFASMKSFIKQLIVYYPFYKLWLQTDFGTVF